MDDTQTARRIGEEALQLGVRPGGVLIVHSSLSSLGFLPDGPNAVVQGLRIALGADGTLLMPALSYELVTPEKPFFDTKTTPSNVGLIPEYFRNLPDTIRSLHPTHSVCAAGSLALKMVGEHSLDTTPCGVHSPFRKLPDFNGQILMLGCGLRPNTSMHAIEELVQPEYLFGSRISYRLTDEYGRVETKTYTIHNFTGWIQRYERISALLPTGIMKQGYILKANSYLIESRGLWSAALQKLTRDPLFFVDRAG